jgi:hypothetical protein
MKGYLLKIVDFTIIYILTDLFFSNLIFFKGGKIFDLSIDGITLMLIITGFLYSFIYIGIIKLVSIKINDFIYNSNVMICYTAFIFRSYDWFYTLFFGWFAKTLSWTDILVNNLITFVSLIVVVLPLYYFWKYRIEISVGMFLGGLLYSDIFNRIPQLKMPDDWKQGITISIIVALFIGIAVSLRKLGVYDFRSQKDKWQEKLGEGPYKIWLKTNKS